jgi:N-acetylglucosaminyldiphosphoundecaprenol N-acetyl-beta-D-mannosaminyltransferase
MRDIEEAGRVLGVKISWVTVSELHTFIAQCIEQDRKILVLNVNVHCLNLAYQQPWLRNFLNSAEVVFCDGAGVILGAKILGFQIPERITYADWIWQLAEFAITNQFSLYLLGAEQGIAEKAAERIKARFPKIRIAGIQHGYFNKNFGDIENEAVIREINAAAPDILVLGFGMPIQEKWLMENWGNIRARVALTGGAVFDYVSGDLPRAPRWMTDHGIEWLGRLVIEPGRLWRRYLIGNPIFFWRIFLQRIGLLRF